MTMSVNEKTTRILNELSDTTDEIISALEKANEIAKKNMANDPANPAFAKKIDGNDKALKTAKATKEDIAELKLIQAGKAEHRTPSQEVSENVEASDASSNLSSSQ